MSSVIKPSPYLFFTLLGESRQRRSPGKEERPRCGSAVLRVESKDLVLCNGEYECLLGYFRRTHVSFAPTSISFYSWHL
ncbi:hypothetical protein SK128_019134 [Halocaridina rubra]|uniref:Uncharacterized protein n=1 Tax=Halocaridina rubra TaxID=373956 RepID=A0AAN8WNS3_HALRR